MIEMTCDNCGLVIYERYPDPDESTDFCSERCFEAFIKRQENTEKQ